MTTAQPSEPDLVWVRGVAQGNYGGSDPVEVYQPYARAEWDAMTEAEREQELDEIGALALERVASYGADVVDESEVPESERQR